ncbi:hypothetical protein TWF281_009604 [Arthrobotrys megalospora]
MVVASAIAANTVAAAPASTNPIEDLKDLQERANNGANCKYKKPSPSPWFTYKVITWGPWAQDNSRGRSLLDNLRGQCGVITDWEFYYRADGAGVAVFKTSPTVLPKCVQDAIRLASGLTNVVLTCTPNL